MTETRGGPAGEDRSAEHGPHLNVGLCASRFFDRRGQVSMTGLLNEIPELALAELTLAELTLAEIVHHRAPVPTRVVSSQQDIP